MNIDIQELLKEVERQFPMEFRICVQEVQIRMLQQQIPEEETAEE